MLTHSISRYPMDSPTLAMQDAFTELSGVVATLDLNKEVKSKDGESTLSKQLTVDLGSPKLSSKYFCMHACASLNKHSLLQDSIYCNSYRDLLTTQDQMMHFLIILR